MVHSVLPVTLQKKNFKVKFSADLFKYNTLGGAENADDLLDRWTRLHEKKASILPRPNFIQWEFEQNQFRELIEELYTKSLNEDTAFAKAWFWVCRQPRFQEHSQLSIHPIHLLPVGSFMPNAAEEILLWYWSAEKFALVKLFKGEYPIDDEIRTQKIYKSRGDTFHEMKRPTTAVSLSNLARFRIRKYFEEKQGVLFNDSWLQRNSPLTTAQIRNKIFQLMSAFHRGIDEGLIPYLPISGKKKRSTEITLSQECTKAAHISIRAYLATLASAKAGIRVECKALERKLVLPLEKIKDDLKMPIIELARHNRIRLAAEETTGYIDECTKLVDRLLSGEEFQKHPVLVQFTSLIHNEPIPSNAAETYLVDRLILSRQNTLKLSKCPNAEVMVLINEDIPAAVEGLSDAYDRMHRLTQKRQATIEQSAQSALNRLRILSTFTNPEAVEEYLSEMKVLRPLILSLHQDLHELNEQQRVVGLPLLRMAEVEEVGSQVNSLWSLFEWTKRFRDFRSNFFKRRRVDARVVECQSFLDTFMETLAELGFRLEGQRAAKIFVTQLRGEIDKFRHNIPVLEVMSCPRLGERHWQKMSDIVGFNLALYENATVAQICELNLNLYVSKLKPIAFIAEREGAISDQANFITEFWAEASFAIDITPFWGVQVPSNLETLISYADEHVSKIQAYRDPENDKSYINQSLDTWIGNLTTVLSLLRQWNILLKLWKRISTVMKHSYSKLPTEFEHFRICAKYFRRLARFVDEERFVIKIVEGKHIGCWLRLSERHLKTVVSGMDGFLGKLRNGSARMCLLSDTDMLKLLSSEPPDNLLQIIQRECFPYFRELYQSDEGELFAVNIDGERIRLEGLVSVADLQEDPQRFVEKVESTVANFIIKDYEKFTQHRSTLKNAFRMTRILNDFLLHTNQDAGFRHQYENGIVRIILRGNQMEVKVTPDFIHSTITAMNADAQFSHHWALGKVPMFSGTLIELRIRIQILCRNLLCSVRFLNCHPAVEKTVFDTVIDAAQRQSVLFVLENIDQLPEEKLSYLLLCLDRLESECVRLVLCTTLNSTAQRLAPHLRIFHSKGGTRPDSPSANLKAPNPNKRRSSSIKPTKKPSSPPKSFKSAEDALTDAIFGAESINYSLSNTNFSIVCIGPTAKAVLSDVLQKGNVKANWIYIDALTYSQVLSSHENFGESTSGYLIKCLKESMAAEEVASRPTTSSFTASQSVPPPPPLASAVPPAPPPPPPPVPNSPSIPTTANTTTSNTDGGGYRRLSVVYRPPVYIIFYGYQQFLSHFPQISSLFYSMATGLVAEMPPQSYITMADGSNFYAARNVRFILCLPNCNESTSEWLNRYEIKTITIPEGGYSTATHRWTEMRTRLEGIVRRAEYLEIIESTLDHFVFPALDEFPLKEIADVDNMLWTLEKDIEEALAFVTNANYSEILHSVTIQSCVQFMDLYLKSELSVLDRFLEERTGSFDKAADVAKIPFPVSEHRLVSYEHGTWTKWNEDLRLKSTMNKEFSLSEIFVSFVDMDRALSFLIRQFLISEKHFILTGPPFSGKSAAAKRVIKHLEGIAADWRFVFMECTDRFDLVKMQKKLAAIAVANKKVCIIFDHFHFCETAKALLEFYNDQTLLVSGGEPQICAAQLRLLLIMETSELSKCWAFGEFRRNFQIIPLVSPSQSDLCSILEKLICWHLNTKTFSSEYLSLVPNLVFASQRTFGLFAKAADRLLPYVIQLAKGLMFAFPDNTPDLESMKRLWIHEVLRTLFDRELNEDIRNNFINDVDGVLQEFTKSTVSTLFPIRSANDEEEEDDIYTKKDGTSYFLPDFRLDKLLYSEMAGLETMDGITYGIVIRRSDFIKTLENLHFEYTRNHEGYQIRLVITDFTSDHSQRIMRASRQHSEHIALAGRPGCGRQQCAKLAAFGVMGTVFHVFFDTQSASAFEESWKRVVIRIIHFLSSNNQPTLLINKIPTEWLTMLKQWLQRPVVGDLLSDTLVIKMAEKMVESEKTLATLVQSSNIRLPGQRYCQFLSFEAFKNVDLLRSTLEARMSDFMHSVFLIPPEALDRFEWCLADYFMPISATECKQMIEKMSEECSATNKNRIGNAVSGVFSATKEAILKAEFSPLKYFSDSKILYDMTHYTVVFYNQRYQQLHKRIELLNSALENTLKVRDLSIIGANSTVFDLTRKLDDEELVLLYFRKVKEETLEALDSDKVKIEMLQRECSSISEKLLQRNAKIGLVLEGPLNEFKQVSEKLSEYGVVEYKKLAKAKTPTLGLKYTVEAVRQLVEKRFKPGRNHLETWITSSQSLTKKGFAEWVQKFDPNSVNANQLKGISAIIQTQELKEQRIAIESPLAADLCRWVKTVASIGRSNKLLKAHRSAANDLTKQLTSKQKSLATFIERQQFLGKQITVLEKEMDSEDTAIHKLHRLIFYRERGDIVINALSPLQNRWKTLITATKGRLDNLLGNCIVQSAFRFLVSALDADDKSNAILKWRSSLLRNNIIYEDKFTSVPVLFLDYFRSMSWREPWPLVHSKRQDIINALKFFYNDCATLDIEETGWMDKDVIDRLLRASYSDSALVIYNVNSEPPAAWYELLLREPDKEKKTVEFMNRAILMGENFKLLFITSKELSTFSTEFIRMISPIKLVENFDFKEGAMDVMTTAEQDLLKLLTDFSAIDILESEDVTNQIIQMAEAVPLNI